MIFPYIFYTLTKFYKTFIDKTTPELYAAGLLTCMQGLNCLVILTFFVDKEYLKICVLSLGSVIFIMNMFVFNRKSFEKYCKQWDKENKSRQFIKRLLVLLYIIFTFGSLTYICLAPK